MDITEEEKYQHRLRYAYIELKELEDRETFLINGNFSAKAKKHNVKVKDLRKYYNEKENNENKLYN